MSDSWHVWKNGKRVSAYRNAYDVIISPIDRIVTIVTYEFAVKTLKMMSVKSHQFDPIIDHVVEKFIELRTGQGLSHEKLAELAGVHRSTISLIESKKRSPTLKNCVKIASALGCDLSKLLSEAEKRNRSEK